MAGSCENDNESSTFVKVGEFLDCLNVLPDSEGEICSMELRADVDMEGGGLVFGRSD